MLQQHIQAASKLLLPMTQTCEIKMEVVFGTPSQNCIGSGVCMIMNRLPRHQQLRCPHAPAWVSFKAGKLVFRFSKSEVFREDAISRFDGPWFFVQESFQVSRYLMRHWDLPSQQVLPGLYAIEETSKDWFLIFSLQHGKRANIGS